MLALLGVTLGLCGAAAYDYNLKNNYVYDGVSYFEVDWGKESAPFLIQHASSYDMYVHPEGGHLDAWDGTYVVVADHYHDACWWTYIPIADRPGFGLIRHHSSGRFIHNEGGSSHPGGGGKLLLDGGFHYGVVWSVQTSFRHIMHGGGLYWHPQGGSVTPSGGTKVVVADGTHEATHWVPRDANGQVVDLHGSVLAGGQWDRIYAVINPEAN